MLETLLTTLIGSGIAALIVTLAEEGKKKGENDNAQEERGNEAVFSRLPSEKPTVAPAPPPVVKMEQAEGAFAADDAAAEQARSFLERAEKMADPAEIAAAFAAEYGSVDNENIREMLRQLNGAYDAQSAVTKLKCFFKHGGKVFNVDRSGKMLACPVCGQEQLSRRQVCHRCGALFDAQN